MTFKKNSRVDVNASAGSNTVDNTGKNMEQKTNTKKTVELIVVRRDKDGTLTPTVVTADSEVRYHFPMSGVVRIVKRTITEEVLFSDAPSTIANLPSPVKQRRPRKKETQAREICVSTCCGAPHRHQSHLDGYCFDCRPRKTYSNAPKWS